MSIASKYPGAALITGASVGIGACFAQRLAADKMDLVLVARSEDKLEALAGKLRQQHGIKAVVAPQDLSAPDAAARVKEAVDASGLEVSLLINNAGFGSWGKFQELPLEEELRMVELNCRTPVAMTGLFLPAMLERRNGALIFLGSSASFQPCPFFATYGATKAFNLMYGEALWHELKGTGVDCTVICPGYTKTEFQPRAGINMAPPMGLWATPEAVVDTCFRSLGRRPSVVHAWYNAVGALAPRFFPRGMTAALAGNMMDPAKHRKS
ncbi:MAG: SDR family oxidoreductase [Candidatus Hydrogenedentes bacterium]|nr:SDR family oxidoreductase [Candidatus Hydrogenedentota bacterium]